MSEAYFLMKYAYQEFKNPKELPLWTKFRLLFKKTYVIFDWQGNPKSGVWAFHYKYLDGRVYSLREEEISNELYEEFERGLVATETFVTENKLSREVSEGE